MYRETRVYQGSTQTVASVDIFLGPNQAGLNYNFTELIQE